MKRTFSIPKLCKENITYYIGILLFPSCVLLSLLEFIYSLDEHKSDFYFIKSLDWFIKLEDDKGIMKAASIVIITTIVTLILISTAARADSWNSVYSQKVYPNQNISVSNVTIPSIQFSSPVTGHMQNGKLVLDYPASPALFIDKINGNPVQVSLTEGEIYTDNKNEIQISASGVVKQINPKVPYDVIRLCITTSLEGQQTYDYTPDEAQSIISVLSQSVGDWLNNTKAYQSFRTNKNSIHK